MRDAGRGSNLVFADVFRLWSIVPRCVLRVASGVSGSYGSGSIRFATQPICNATSIISTSIPSSMGMRWQSGIGRIPHSIATYVWECCRRTGRVSGPERRRRSGLVANGRRVRETFRNRLVCELRAGAYPPCCCRTVSSMCMTKRCCALDNALMRSGCCCSFDAGLRLCGRALARRNACNQLAPERHRV